MDADGYYQTYTKGDPMMENEQRSLGYTVIDGGMAGSTRNSSLDEAMEAHASPSGPPEASSSGATRLAPLLSTVPSGPTMANQSEGISPFLVEVGFTPFLVPWRRFGTRWRSIWMVFNLWRRIVEILSPTGVASRAAGGLK